ncbi:MAG: hypothetical protein OXI96_06935 [Acidimicrobiaceae bacterium]|nr:hypothetical protein [Acidimicrobiaceae bacterium]
MNTCFSNVFHIRTYSACSAAHGTLDGVLEETTRLVEQSGGEVVYIDHTERDERSVLGSVPAV